MKLRGGGKENLSKKMPKIKGFKRLISIRFLLEYYIIKNKRPKEVETSFCYLEKKKILA
jgi:hypothetical protein